MKRAGGVRSNLNFYDAPYLALAERLSMSLLTLPAEVFLIAALRSPGAQLGFHLDDVK